ncbi:MAG TPA: CPBP family intramembrane glutamic endopeptidase [Candidatus Angelobacter sp.]
MIYPQALFIRRHPAASYFTLAFTISWTGALVVAAPHLLRHEPLPKMTGILMFPAMLLGPSVTGIFLTRIIDGSSGLRSLFSRMLAARFALRWYAALLIPPVLVPLVLLCLERFVSSVYAPRHFFFGIAFAIPAGLLEEIGWMGYAFPKLQAGNNRLLAGILLGLLWSLWHLPVIDFLGAAAPHGAYWLPFFLAFALAMTAMRVLIAWIYANTGSVLLAQVMHVSSTGSLIIFGPAVNAAQEALWYAVYGVALWLVVAVVGCSVGRQLMGRVQEPPL